MWLRRKDMAVCTKQHRYLPDYLLLPTSQDNQSGDRHICAGCAYEAGLDDGLHNREPRTDLSDLPTSQAGTVRHKGAMEAYLLGYKYGQERSS